MRKFSIIIIICISIAGCKRIQAPVNKAENLEFSSEFIENNLEQAAFSIESALLDFNSKQDKRSNIKSLIDTEFLLKKSNLLAKKIALDWSGPVEPLLEKIAKKLNYNFYVLGKNNSSVALVSIYKKDARIADILKDIDIQINFKARLVIFPESQSIELRYL